MLQFHLTRLFGTQFKTHGVAIPKPAGLQLVFREGEAEGPKIMDQEIKSVLIEWDNLASLEFKKGFFGTQLLVAIRSVSRVTDLPGLEDSQLELKIHRSNIDDIKPFERLVATYRSGNVDENVDEFIDDMRDFLDASHDLENPLE